VVNVAIEDLTQLADRALRIIDGVDLGECDAVARAIGLDVEDAAVGLDRGRPIARREEDAGQTALERNRPPCAIAACAASMSTVSACR
jgi:hypothetical protein